jgi:DNA-binding NarL/FixJ family response regulator
MKILLADDHALFREGMRYVLRELAESVALLEAADCDSALRHAADHPDIDLVLLDLNMPGVDGFAVLDLFSSRYPALPVVILSASNQQGHMQRALNAGALGFIPKETTGMVMLNALRLVLSGGIYVPPSIALKESPETRGVKSGHLESQAFTPRQQETLKLLVQGYSNKEIARRMDLAEATVKMHITAIFKSLGVSNRTQAVLAAKNLNLGFNTD